MGIPVSHSNTDSIALVSLRARCSAPRRPALNHQTRWALKLADGTDRTPALVCLQRSRRSASRGQHLPRRPAASPWTWLPSGTAAPPTASCFTTTAWRCRSPCVAAWMMRPAPAHSRSTCQATTCSRCSTSRPICHSPMVGVDRTISWTSIDFMK